MAYDAGKAFARIEDELIRSMMRNLGRHLKEESEEGFDWSQWQVEQLKYLEEYKRRNQKRFGPEFKKINERMKLAVQEQAEKGQKDEELRILRALANNKKLQRKYKNKAISIEAQGDAFFRVNDYKLNALLDATENDMTRAEYAVLRRTNDQYRKIIFDAQVYANTGAATPEKAVDMATKDFLARGIDSIQYKNGSRHTISDYADMYIRTAERRAYHMGEGKKRQEWGEQLVIVNKRSDLPCPHCIPWIGKILIDDVYSGGKPDGKHKLLSEAMADGFLHPRCKDGFTTYFPGVTTVPDPATKEEIKAAVEKEKAESKENTIERNIESNERLAKMQFDSDNQRMYASRANGWKKANVRFKTGNLTAEEYEKQKRLESALAKRAEDFKGLSETEARKALLTEAENWDTLLSAREKRSLTKYSFNMGDSKGNEFFRRLNSALASGKKLSKSLETHSNNISSALKKFSLKENIVCYRGVDFNPVAEKNIGDTYFPGHFLSSSVTRKGAFDKKWILEIHARPGASGGFIENYSPYGKKQSEFLFDKDCVYRILRISGNKIVLEVV